MLGGIPLAIREMAPMLLCPWRGRLGEATSHEDTVDYTHYDYLELPPGASAARIEAAYQTIRQRISGDADRNLLALVHEAYEVLSDPGQRQNYDRELQRTAEEADRELKSLLDTEAKRMPRRVQEVPIPLLAVVNAWAA